MDQMTTKNHMMRTLVTALAILTISGQAWGQEWQTLSFPDRADITGICFVHPDTGFVVTNVGGMGRTVDGGQTWRLFQVTKGAALEDVSFVSGNLGFVCGRAGSLYRTVDGGLNWDNKCLKDTIPWLFDVEMLDAKTVVVAGATRADGKPFEGLLRRSSDGGKSFTELPGVGMGYKEFFFRRGGPLYLLATGKLATSDDLGASWKPNLIGLPKPGRALSFSGKTGVIAGPRGMIAFSADNGRTWRSNDQAEDKVFIAVEMIDDKVGYIGGHPDVLLKTEDGGRTWTDETPETKFTVLDFYLIADRLYAVGRGGAIAVKKVR